MKKNYLEILVGVAIVVVSVVLVLFAVKVADKKINQEFYTLFANFDNIEGISIGAKIKIGGIEIGEVDKLLIDNGYRVRLVLKIKKDINIPADSVIKVSTSGIIGGKYLKVEVGGEERFLKKGDSFEFTESSLDLEEMITRFMLNSVSKDKNEKK
jgi:phospholipid/cholesterol/gamma-HCH transport system substrate-binding protein